MVYHFFYLSLWPNKLFIVIVLNYISFAYWFFRFTAIFTYSCKTLLSKNHKISNQTELFGDYLAFELV